MILKHIEAENVLKYRQLKLTDLPARGQIAVSGRNEAGKTAVGETICLGLFGRTFSLGSSELEKVIRWGEYHGMVRVTFIARDNNEYTVVREIDNTGGHSARLYSAEEPDPISEGVDEVDAAIRELAGFTYESFIDSFYLAQREMEVPHGKSATVKALIGVDKLERAASELRGEMAATGETIRNLEAEVKRNDQRIAEIDIDRAHLGRLEAERDAEAEATAAAEAEGAELAERARTIGKAANAFVEASRAFVESSVETNYGQWRARRHGVAMSLAAVATASDAAEGGADTGPFHGATSALQTFEEGLAEYEKVRNLAGLYRRRLAYLLDDGLDEGVRRGGAAVTDVESETRFSQRRAAASGQVQRFSRSRRPLLASSIVLGELACMAWAGWIVLAAAPDSALSGWMRGLIAISESALQSVFLVTGVTATAVTILLIAWYVGCTRRLRQAERRLDEIEQDVEIARLEMDMIDEIEEAPLPQAVKALRNARNDLLSSAVVSFEEGGGAVFVHPDALAAKLTEIREGAGKAVKELKDSQGRLAERASDLKRRAGDLREVVSLLNEDIAKERERWGQVESLERIVAGLEARIEDLRKEIVVRKLACELIEGACRRIYGRFQRELRRFVSKILPHLTEDRYEQLEIDSDLRVRVFCKDKNDFVGLAEISNGTHRQLMLCVRLALSQALIASSSKSAQFIFFDEPFAFFDEQRMAKAIDVLRRISPQINQVWLAAQKFEHPAAFDLVLDCDVEMDRLEAAGNGAASRGKSCYRVPDRDLAEAG